jgi:Peptidase_C39 like family
MDIVNGSDDYVDETYETGDDPSVVVSESEPEPVEYEEVAPEASTDTAYEEPAPEPVEEAPPEPPPADATEPPSEQSVIPPGQPGGPPEYEEPAAEAPSVPAEAQDQSVIPPGQPGGPGYEATAEPDISTGPIAEPVEGYEQSVIPPGQPGGPGYEDVPLAYDDEGNPAIYGVEPDPSTGTGTWWTPAAPVTECCVPLPDYQPTTDATSASGLVFVDSQSNTETLPGIDSNADGVADFTTLDANQDGKIDTWFADTTGSGTVDTIYYDANGDGFPEAFTRDPEGAGQWSQPELLPPAAQSVIPTGQPGGPGGPGIAPPPPEGSFDPSTMPYDPRYDVRGVPLEVSGEEQGGGATGTVEPGLLESYKQGLPLTIPDSELDVSSTDEQAAGVIPPGQPGSGDVPASVMTAMATYTPGPGANLAAICACTPDVLAQAAIAAIATAEPTPAPPPVLDPASDTTTPPPTGLETDLPPSTLPTDWEEWTPETEPSPDSYTEGGYSTDWGQVTPDWAQSGEEPFTETPPGPSLTTLVGPGHEADVYWAYQGDTQYCGLYSVRSILSEVYGMDVDINEIVQRAEDNGWLVRENGVVKGIYNSNVETILESYGVPSHARSGATNAFEDLNTALTNDQRVVLSVDGNEFDAQANVGIDTPGVDTSNHLVAVTGIDYNKGVVIVNDSARSAGLEVPMSVFQEAWADSNYQMTITDAAATAKPGYAILGTTLEARPSG